MTKQVTVAGFFLGILVVFACSSNEHKADLTAQTNKGDVVARWDGGTVSLAQVESAVSSSSTKACRKMRRNTGSRSAESVATCYQEVAQNLVLEEVVSATSTDPKPSVDRVSLRRNLVNVHERRRQKELQELLTDDEVSKYFAGNRKLFVRPATVQLSNIFRRHADSARPEATLAFLRDLKQRFTKGQTFAALAREYSHSETRLRDGVVGPIREGTLAPSLDKIAFALEPGTVADPVLVRGGAVLLHVQTKRERVNPTLGEVEAQVRRHLAGERFAAERTQQVAAQSIPKGSTVLSTEALIKALDGPDQEAPALEIAGDRITVKELRAWTGLKTDEMASSLSEEKRQQLESLYDKNRRTRLFGLFLEKTAQAAVQDEAKTRVRTAALRTRVDDLINKDLHQQVQRSTDKLRSYFDDNRHHFQTPLRFDLKIWSLPFGADPPAQLAQMEKLQRKLGAGEVTLSAAAKKLGGEITDLGWRTFADLKSELPRKTRGFLSQMQTAGFTVPYHQEESLHVIWVKARQEPRQMTFVEAKQDVTKAYLERFQQDLTKQAVDVRLSGAGFVFDRATVLELLVSPAQAGG